MIDVQTLIVLFVLAAVYFVWSARTHPGREEQVRTRELEPQDAAGPTA